MSALRKVGIERLIGQTAVSVKSELAHAMDRFPPLNSPHEGIAVIHEEFLELQEHVYDNTGRSDAAYAEAIQLAAMAMRYAIDLFPGRAAGGDA